MLLPFGLTTGLTRSLGLVVALVASTHAVYIPHGPSLPPYSLVHGDVTTASTSTTSLVADASTTNTAPSSIRLSLTRYSTSTRTVHVVETVTPAAASASSNSVESGSADVAFTSTDVVTDVVTFTPEVVSTPTDVVFSSTDAVSASSGVVSSSGSVVSSSTDGVSTSIEVGGTLTVFPEVTSTSTSTTTRRTTITSVVTATPSVADRNAFLSTANAIDRTPLVIMPYDDTWHTAFVTSRRRGKRNAAVSSVSSSTATDASSTSTLTGVAPVSTGAVSLAQRNLTTEVTTEVTTALTADTSTTSATDASTSTSSPLSTSTTTVTSTLHILVTSVVQVASAAFTPTNPKIVTAPMVSHLTALVLTDASTSTSSLLSTSTTTITSTSTTTSYTTVTATAVIVPEPTLSTLDEAKEGCLVCQDIFDDNGEVPPETLPNNSRRRRMERSLDSLEEDGKVSVRRKLVEGESADANVTADVTAVDGQEDGDAPSVVTRQLVPPDLFNITLSNHTNHTDRTGFKPIRLSPINNITIPAEGESGEAPTVDTDGRDDAIVTRQLVPPGLNKLNITDNPPPFLPTNINFTNYTNDATYTTRTGKPIRLSPINNITLTNHTNHTTRTVLRLKPLRLPPINNITIPNGTLPNHTNHTLITRRTSFKLDPHRLPPINDITLSPPPMAPNKKKRRRRMEWKEDMLCCEGD